MQTLSIIISSSSPSSISSPPSSATTVEVNMMIYIGISSYDEYAEA